MKLFFPERTIHADGWYRVMQPPAISGLTSHRRNIRLCITRSPPSVSHKSAFWFIFPPTPFYHIHRLSSIGIFHNKLVHNLCVTTIYSTDNANFSPPKNSVIPPEATYRRTENHSDHRKADIIACFCWKILLLLNQWCVILNHNNSHQ